MNRPKQRNGRRTAYTGHTPLSAWALIIAFALSIAAIIAIAAVGSVPASNSGAIGEERASNSGVADGPRGQPADKQGDTSR